MLTFGSAADADRSPSHQAAVRADPSAHVGQDDVAAALTDEYRQEPVDECHQKEEPFEAALLAPAPPHTKRVPEHGREEADGKELQQRPEGQPRTGLIIRRLIRSEQIVADGSVDDYPAACVVPVRVESARVAGHWSAVTCRVVPNVHEER